MGSPLSWMLLIHIRQCCIWLFQSQWSNPLDNWYETLLSTHDKYLPMSRVDILDELYLGRWCMCWSVLLLAHKEVEYEQIILKKWTTIYPVSHNEIMFLGAIGNVALVVNCKFMRLCDCITKWPRDLYAKRLTDLKIYLGSAVSFEKDGNDAYLLFSSQQQMPNTVRYCYLHICRKLFMVMSWYGSHFFLH